MTTMTPNNNQPRDSYTDDQERMWDERSEPRNSYDDDQDRIWEERKARARRRHWVPVRQFMLGFGISALCIAGTWIAVDAIHAHADTPASHSTPAAATPASNSSAGNSQATSYKTGPDVVQLQRDLGQLNYYESTVDGIYGPATTAAVEDFQRANGLTVDGIAGPQTMAKIQQQLVTGDNQMGPSGQPAHNTGDNGQNSGGASGNGQSTGGSSSTGHTSATGGTSINTSSATPSA